MKELELLWEVQELRKRKEKILNDFKKNSQSELLKKLKEEIEHIQIDGRQMTSKLNTMKKDLKEIEDVISIEKEKKKKINEEIYSNKLPMRELESAQLNINSLEEKIKYNEEIALNIMEEVEKEEEKLKLYLNTLNKKKEEFRELKSQYLEKKNETNLELDNLNAIENNLCNSIGSETLELYQKLCGNYKDKQGIAIIKSGTCGGCHTSLSFELLKKAKNEQVNCDRCGRFLLNN